jgi:hypothetical protein
MTKESDPSFNGSPPPDKRLSLTESEYFALRLACLTEYQDGEPEVVTKARNRVEVAERVAEYLKRCGFPPIFGTFEETALKLKGRKR